MRKMTYELTEEQTMLRETIARMAKEQIAPGAEQRDEEGKFSWDMVELLRENGLFGADFPEEYGGAHMGLLSFCLIGEELARVCASTSLIPLVHELGSIPIMIGANDEQKQRWLPDLASGEKLAAFGLTEPNAGSDVAGLKTKAVKDGDDYILNGSKNFISHGDVADLVCVAAKTDLNVRGHKGTSVFVIEKGTPGFSVGKKENKMGFRASSTAELIFEDVQLPAANRLPKKVRVFISL